MRGFEEELRLARRSTDGVLRHGTAPVSFHHGAAAFRALVEQQPDIEAIFAVSDLSAVGAVMEAQRMNLRIPDDISIMGFGDFEIGREINPALTTIHVDFHALGLRTGKMLVDLLASDATPAPSTVDVGLRIVERASVKDR
jgi:LacI family gluconate utilization system Gnt-I transcriptional repressor